MPSTLTSLYLLELLISQLVNRPAHVDAGIVDQDMDATQLGDGPVDHRLDVLGPCDIRLHAPALDAKLTGHAVRYLFSFGTMSAGEQNLSAGRGKSGGNRLTQPLGPTGHDRRLATQVKLFDTRQSWVGIHGGSSFQRRRETR